jgi:hypothetical protein
MYYCDCCNAPMCTGTNYRAETYSVGDTSACILCAGDGMPRKLDILAEIVDLGQHWNEDKVVDRILRLGDLLKDAK